MNKYTELIDNYLQGRMTGSEKEQFEKHLKEDDGLRKEFELQQQLLKGIHNAGLRTEINKGLHKGKLKRNIRTWATAIVITGLVTAVALVVKNNISSHSENIKYELNESNTRQWTDADKNLTPEFFTITGARDTVIETKGGILFAIPAQAFLNAYGENVSDGIEIEVKEALTPLDIMKAGLSTMSNGELLETGGMFYLNARQNGKSLDIAHNKSIYTSIPDLQPGKEMMLFEGKREPGKNQINWINPRPFGKKLRTVDILSLNFYPPGFLDSLKAFGIDVKNKERTDSIYYSFVCAMQQPAPQAAYSDSMDWPKDSSSHGDGEEVRDGAKLFKQNCAACHSTGTERLSGPGLAGITSRAPGGDWLIRYILNNEKLIKSGDAYANKISKENGYGAMTVFEGQLNKEDVKAILNFIKSGSVENIANSGRSECEIDPSRIRAIWNKKFNGTLLATREFEERLQVIFKTCNHSILDLYVMNMNKKMYDIDSLASIMNNEVAGPDSTKASAPFKRFYLRKDGGVSISESHIQKLHAYMEEKQKLYKELAEKSFRELCEKEKIMDQRAFEKRIAHQKTEGDRMSKTFAEELDMNLTEAYRQLGKSRPVVQPVSGSYLSGTITNTGWNNVDRYVIESTANRSTLNYTDPQSGKKAIINYKPFNVTVTNSKEFDRVYAYLIPDKLSSFQRMQGSGGQFKENLNELLNYSAMVIGFKGETAYNARIQQAAPGEQNVTLTKMNIQEMDRFRSTNRSALNDIMTDLNYQLFEQKEQVRQNAIARREEIRDRLWTVVFPCGVRELPDF